MTTKEPTSYRDVVKSVLPAVVSVEAKSVIPAAFTVPRRLSTWNDMSGFTLPPEVRSLFDDIWTIRETPVIQHRGIGSGFIADPSGVIVTNNHVVRGANKVTVQLADGRKFDSREIKSDPKTDLALILIDAPTQLPHVKFDDSATVEIGDRVLAMGSPFGFRGTVTSGIISGKGRNPNATVYEDFLQTDAAINPGNSGGPLVNLDGKVVGVNTAIHSNSGGSQGIGFAIPSNVVRDVMDKLLKHGVVHRGYLGVQIGALDPEVGARIGAESGVVVARVMESSPAAKAGIEAGDVIVSVAGLAVKEPTDLQRRIAAQPPRQPIAIRIVRVGKPKEISAVLDEQSEPVGSRTNASLPAPAGVTINDIGVELTDGATGALVTRVEPGSLAAMAGLRPGATIARIDSTPVNGAADARQALTKAALSRGVVLQTRAGDSAGYLILKVN